METINWKRKLSSRKLWAACAGIVTGLAMVFGLDESTISTVAGAVVSAASVVAYVLAEGKVDAESVKKAPDSVQGAAEAVGKVPDTVYAPGGLYDIRHTTVSVFDEVRGEQNE